jgi:NADPH:quinone reductase-like Zn-dependent oxidoreductase
MRAIGVTEFGGPDALHAIDLPDPELGSGQIRIRVRAAAVNPTDTVLRAGLVRERIKDLDPPFVPGMDAAGVVDEIAADADTDLQVGDQVMAVVVPRGWHGAYSEELVLPAGSVTRAPAGQSLEAAATLPMNGLTARCALDELDLEAGQTLAVTGAAGTLGSYVVELAEADGLRVVADAAPKDEQLVRNSGADVVVARGDGVAERIRAEVPDGVDGLVDCAVLDDQIIGAVRDGGRIATVRGFSGTPERGITYHPVWVVQHAEERGKLDQLRAQVESGALTLRVAATFPAAQASEAHQLLEAGGTRGRAVLTF